MIKNLTGQKWTVFAFDATTGLPKTGDAANITANLRLDGGAANAVDDTNPTELEDGYYVFDITQAETNADHIIICPQSSTTDIIVIGVPGAVWTTPAKQAATLAAADVTGNLPVNVVQAAGTAWGSGAITAGSIASNAITDAKINTGAITAAKIASNAITDDKIASNAIANAKIADGAISVGKIADNAITAAKIAADAIGASELATDAVEEIAAGVWGTATRTLTGTQAFSLTGNITGNLSGSVGSVSGAVGSVSGSVTVGTNNDKTGYSLATAPPSATAIRQEMDSSSTKLANLDAAITSRLAANSYTAPANAAITDIKAVTDKLNDTLELDSGKNRFTADALAEAPTGGGGGSGPTAEEIAEAVWDEAITDHLDAGSTGNALNAAGSAGDPWATPLPGSYGAGSAGRIIGDNLDDKVTSRSTLTAAQVWAYATRTLTAISDSAGITTLLSRISQALGFSNGNVNVHVKGKDNLDFGAAEKASLDAATPAVTVSDKTGFSLTPAYDAAKTAATQASVNAIPTNPVLTNDARLNNLDATISSRLADYEYIAPANADIAAVKAKTDNLPASPAAVGSEMVLTSAYDAAKTAASQSSVDTIDDNVDDIKLKTDALTFGKAEQVDVNVRSINYETITGTGRVGDEFGVD